MNDAECAGLGQVKALHALLARGRVRSNNFITGVDRADTVTEGWTNRAGTARSLRLRINAGSP